MASIARVRFVEVNIASIDLVFPAAFCFVHPCVCDFYQLVASVSISFERCKPD